MASPPLEALCYTVADVQARKDPAEYVQQIIVNERDVRTAIAEAGSDSIQSP